MSEAATTRMSSKGQVVIPERIRAKLGLEPGVELVVIGEGDTIVLKRIDLPRMSEFAEIVAQARLAARRAGMKRSDVAAAIDAVRAR